MDSILYLPCRDEMVYSQQNTQVGVVTTGRKNIEQVSDHEADLRAGNHFHTQRELLSTERPTHELSTANIGSSTQELQQVFEEES